jgi:hypothetical protein
VTATAGATIEGVSVLSKQGNRNDDRFAIALSRRGLEVRRRGRPTQLMTWDRVSRWEVEERDGHVLLTLRSNGAATPLVVPGWTLNDLEVLMRDVTSDPGAYAPGQSEQWAAEPEGGVATAPAPRPVPDLPRAERRRPRHKPPNWKPVVTVVLLCALAAGVTLVLLQSAGIINWSFLGPVA